jgi:hypothetical protein
MSATTTTTRAAAPQGAPSGGGAPTPLEQRQNESDTAYEAFLLWAMQTPDARSNRLLARSLSTAESNVRMWRKKYGWEMRAAQVQQAEYACLQLYRKRMEEHVGKDRADMMRAALDIVLDRAGYARLRADVRRQRAGLDSNLNGSADKSANGSNYKSAITQGELSDIDPANYMRELGTRIRTTHLREDDMRKQILLIDAVLGLIARRVQSGELQVRVSDIPSLLKARALLTGLPTEQVAVHAQVQHEVRHTVETLRMRTAKAAGGGEKAVVQAMREDVEELRVILDSLPKEPPVIDIGVHDE